MSHLAVKTVRPSVQSVERAVRKQARKNNLMPLHRAIFALGFLRFKIVRICMHDASIKNPFLLHPYLPPPHPPNLLIPPFCLCTPSPSNHPKARVGSVLLSIM